MCVRERDREGEKERERGRGRGERESARDMIRRPGVVGEGEEIIESAI